MSKAEVLKIMAVLKAAYPSYYRDGDVSAAANLWAEMFVDDEPGMVAAAVKSYIASDVKGFPPVIGQIKAMLCKIKQPNVMTEIEAWGYVKKAMSNSAWHAKDEHAKLPPVIQTIVSVDQLRDWAISDLADEQVIASNFMRSYRAKAQAVKEYEALPSEVKRMIGQFSGAAQIGGGAT